MFNIRPFSGTMGRMGLTNTSIAHVRLTVTDIERSRRFYESVFGWPVLLEVPDNADASTREQLSFLFGGVIYDLGGTLLGLRPVATDRFDEDRTGLDHIAFRLDSRDELMRPQRIWTSLASLTSRSRTSARPTSCSSAIPTTSPWS